MLLTARHAPRPNCRGGEARWMNGGWMESLVCPPRSTTHALGLCRYGWKSGLGSVTLVFDCPMSGWCHVGLKYDGVHWCFPANTFLYSNLTHLSHFLNPDPNSHLEEKTGSSGNQFNLSNTSVRDKKIFKNSIRTPHRVPWSARLEAGSGSLGMEEFSRFTFWGRNCYD